MRMTARIRSFFKNFVYKRNKEGGSTITCVNFAMPFSDLWKIHFSGSGQAEAIEEKNQEHDNR